MREKLKKMKSTEAALAERRKQIHNDELNFSSDQVLKQFVKEKNEMTYLVSSQMVKKYSKIWKPDKFSFGKKKEGKGVGLASIVELI